MSTFPRLSQQPRGSIPSEVSCGGGLQIHAAFSSAAGQVLDDGTFTILATVSSAASSIAESLRRRVCSGPPAIQTSPPSSVQASVFVNWWLAGKTESGSLAIGEILGRILCLEPMNCQFAVLNNMNDPFPNATLDAHVVWFASHHRCP